MVKRILITGSEGYLGRQLVDRLGEDHEVVGIDIKANASTAYTYRSLDIRDPELPGWMAEQHVSHVVHLAGVLQPSGNPARDYDIDVNGTRNVLEGCVHAGVRHLTVTSSGAAYGYHPDNPDWIEETDPLRGHERFSYSQHKRLIEEMLAHYRATRPALKQLVLRPGTVLGARTDNPITRLFQRDRLLTIRGSQSPFVFIWDQDVVDIVHTGVRNEKTGCYNLAGDGALTMEDIARLLDKPCLSLPAVVLKTGLAIGHFCHLTAYGPEQIDFLRYRPVLSNDALKYRFGYPLKKTSREVFEYYARHQGLM
ncbi:SDR family oxidoreductase [Saccharospirillum salsuginis]|uniref:NAD-dependent dehydratase n=1 Tax=Saccharospirillum salsuginis TaxID=418750 RepID=A0A918N6V5_9GAMM|nr:SDR family oxidoreductase [Saccharospirillum salsuginis]GGX45123.1 NAD-dependent dehydratase [Saccharospirillum salsuginis]